MIKVHLFVASDGQQLQPLKLALKNAGSPSLSTNKCTLIIYQQDAGRRGSTRATLAFARTERKKTPLRESASNTNLARRSALTRAERTKRETCTGRATARFASASTARRFARTTPAG